MMRKWRTMNSSHGDCTSSSSAHGDCTSSSLFPFGVLTPTGEKIVISIIFHRIFISSVCNDHM
jgi:hypothetical protein